MAIKKNCSVVIITTPQGDDNYVTQLTNIRTDDEEPLINLIHVGKPCEICMASDTPGKCTHQAQAPWKDTGRQKKFAEYLYGEQNKDANMREQFGMPTQTLFKSFPNHLIEELYLRPRITTLVPPKIIFFMADPAHGGQSELGLAAGYYDGLRLNIIFMESIKMNLDANRPEKDIIIRCIKKIRSNPNYADSFVVFGAEAYPLLQPTLIATALTDVEDFKRNVLCMREIYQKSSRHYGLPKTNENTYDSVNMFRFLLGHRALAFSSDFMTLENSEEYILKKLRDLLMVHQWKPKKSGEGGRLDAKVHGNQDDLLVALIMVHYWGSYFNKSQDPYYYDFFQASQSIQMREDNTL